MKLVKRISLIVLSLILTIAPLISVSGATFIGDDKIVIVLDPGHGGRDPGAAGVQAEAYYNLTVAHIIREKLEANGNFVVHMTRSTADKYMTLAERLYFADTVNADVGRHRHIFHPDTAIGTADHIVPAAVGKFYPAVIQKQSSI